jgi:single stranded DNA-binding protein
MATVFETRLIGNLGRDASVRNMERGVIAINFPVAHNKNWRDKKTGETKTRTTWVNCTIWKKEGSNMRVLDFLTRGTMVELIGTPFAKAYQQEDGALRTEIRLNVSKTNILKPNYKEDGKSNEFENENFDDEIEDFTLDEEDF